MIELQLHSFNELINVRVHLLHRNDVVLILVLDCLLKFDLKFIFVFDYFLASLDLNFDILSCVNPNSYLHRQVLCSLLSLRALASSSRFRRFSYVTWWPHFGFYLLSPSFSFLLDHAVCFQYRRCQFWFLWLSNLSIYESAPSSLKEKWLVLFREKDKYL